MYACKLRGKGWPFDVLPFSIWKYQDINDEYLWWKCMKTAVDNIVTLSVNKVGEWSDCGQGSRASADKKFFNWIRVDQMSLKIKLIKIYENSTRLK